MRSPPLDPTPGTGARHGGGGGPPPAAAGDGARRTVRRQRWLLATSWTLAIYVTLPVALPVWRGLLRASAGATRHIALAGVAAAAIAVIVTSTRRPPRPARVLGLLGIAGIYAAALTLLPLTPGERTHLVSYGVLAWLLYRALLVDLSAPAGAVAAVVVVAAAGLGDELLQAVLPNRFFEWKDVLLNAFSGGLAVAVVMLTHSDPAPGDPR